MEAVPLVRGRVVRVEFERAQVVGLSSLPVEVVTKDCEAERAVGFGERAVERDGLGCSLLRRRRALDEGQHSVDAEEVVVVCNACVCERVIGVERDGLMVACERAREAFFSKGAPVIAPAQVRLERLGVISAALGETASLVARELRDERLCDLRGYCIFEAKYVRELLVELSGPDGRALAHV